MKSQDLNYKSQVHEILVNLENCNNYDQIRQNIRGMNTFLSKCKQQDLVITELKKWTELLDYKLNKILVLNQSN